MRSLCTGTGLDDSLSSGLLYLLLGASAVLRVLEPCVMDRSIMVEEASGGRGKTREPSSALERGAERSRRAAAEWRRCPPHHHQQPLQLQSSEFLEFFRLYLQRLLVLGLSIEISYHRVWRHVLPGPCAPAGSISAAGAISSIIARMLYSLTLSGIIATSLALGLLGLFRPHAVAGSAR